jgi:hypothetical protein
MPITVTPRRLSRPPLGPANSFVRYAVEQGNTVFMVSWRNVTAEQGHLTWDDYLELGIAQAIDSTLAITGADRLNALGFCVGGTLLGCAAAVLAARGEKKIATLTFMTTMLDFSDPGEIGLLIDEAGVAARERMIGKGGIMPGEELAFVFSTLRGNDLIWPYVSGNYLEGRQPDAFDLLFWNADSTNLPGPSRAPCGLCLPLAAISPARSTRRRAISEVFGSTASSAERQSSGSSLRGKFRGVGGTIGARGFRSRPDHSCPHVRSSVTRAFRKSRLPPADTSRNGAAE